MAHDNRFLIIFKNAETFPLLDYLTVKRERGFDHASISVYSGFVISHQKWCHQFIKMLNEKKQFNLFPDLFIYDFSCCKALEAEVDL